MTTAGHLYNYEMSYDVDAREAIRMGLDRLEHNITLGADRLGTIEAGKLADLYVVRGNPLEDITAARNVELVVKDGFVYRPAELLGRVVHITSSISDMVGLRILRF